ncbi:hypothetical protein B7494_g4307 [Chlorociboria aeruginascens]|nr:hypothetical protein B7494_g4307 [Chlorociboria aeruginascens]
MPSTLEDSVERENKYEDHSGIDIKAYANPYDALITACNNEPIQIQNRYEMHRTTRNTQQKMSLLSPDFPGLILDPILRKLLDHTIEPRFEDPRNCLVFWARPPIHIKELIGEIQKKLRDLAPNSLTPPEIATILKSLTPSLPTITDYTYIHRSLLYKPVLSFDGAAVALSFLPGPLPPSHQSSNLPEPLPEETTNETYTYHHLRRSLYALSSQSVTVASRYIVPSSHITLSRFVTEKDHDSAQKLERWVSEIEAMNVWLKQEYWGEKGEWIVGQEKGLECRKGALWYGGGGECVMIGKGF